MILTYQELVDRKPFKCWTLYDLGDERKPENTNNEHSHLGGTYKQYAAVDTMYYPKISSEASAGRWSAPGQAGVVSPCWSYVTVTRDYSTKNTGALVWLNILLGEPPPVPLPGQEWDPGWADVATGWKIMLVHLSELYVTKRMVVPPGFLLGRLMDEKQGNDFVPHVHNELHQVKGPTHRWDPRPLYYDNLKVIKYDWEWSDTRWSFGKDKEKMLQEHLADVLTNINSAREKLQALLTR